MIEFKKDLEDRKQYIIILNQKLMNLEQNISTDKKKLSVESMKMQDFELENNEIQQRLNQKEFIINHLRQEINNLKGMIKEKKEKVNLNDTILNNNNMFNVGNINNLVQKLGDNSVKSARISEEKSNNNSGRAKEKESKGFFSKIKSIFSKN
jgi:chromosome segregation ATPase